MSCVSSWTHINLHISHHRHHQHHKWVLTSPSSNAATSISLKLHYDISQFQVTFFLQVSQHSGTEEHFALTDTVQVWIKLQSFNLRTGTRTTAIRHSAVSMTKSVKCNVPPDTQESLLSPVTQQSAVLHNHISSNDTLILNWNKNYVHQQ